MMSTKLRPFAPLCNRSLEAPVPSSTTSMFFEGLRSERELIKVAAGWLSVRSYKDWHGLERFRLQGL